jgi:hypothetical protein
MEEHTAYYEVVESICEFLTHNSDIRTIVKDTSYGCIEVEHNGSYHSIDVFAPGEQPIDRTEQIEPVWRVKVYCNCDGQMDVRSHLIHLSDPNSLPYIRACILHQVPVEQTPSGRYKFYQKIEETHDDLDR